LGYKYFVPTGLRRFPQAVLLSRTTSNTLTEHYPNLSVFSHSISLDSWAGIRYVEVIPGVQFAGAPPEDTPRRARLDWSNRRAATIELLKVKKLPIQQSMSITPDDEFFVHYPDGWLRRQAALVEIAKHAGAWAEFLERPDQADEIYTRVLTDIDRRYVLGYYPSNRTRDGKRRKVSVEVRGHPEYLAWGQKTYFASRSRDSTSRVAAAEFSPG
jgi:hypothetical protein